MTIWQSDWGVIILPDDFPFAALRKDGWFDKRRKISKQIQRYITHCDEILSRRLGHGALLGPSFESVN